MFERIQTTLLRDLVNNANNFTHDEPSIRNAAKIVVEFPYHGASIQRRKLSADKADVPAGRRPNRGNKGGARGQSR